MAECPLEHHAGSPWLKEEPVKDFTSRHVKLSLRGKHILDRLLVLLPSHLKSHPTSRVSPFPPALLFSICDALQLDRAEENDPSVLPSVLSKLRDWRLLDPDHRHSPGGVHKLAFDLASITNEASASTSPDLGRTSHPRLRIKWVSSDLPSDSQEREPSLATPPSPSSSRSGALDSAQECAHALPDLNRRRPDAGYESFQVSRLGTPDSEDASAVVSPRPVSGFRSGCSACRHLRLSSLSTPPSPSPYLAFVPFSNVNRFDVNVGLSVPASPRHPKPSDRHARTKKTRRDKHKPVQSTFRGMHVDENEPPIPKPMGIQQGIGVLFPRQRTHSPRISNTHSSRELFSPVAASVQRHLEPSHLLNHARQGDKHASSHRVASVDLRLSIANPSPTHASPNDLHPHAPTRAQSFSYTPATFRGAGGAGAWVRKPSSGAAMSRSSERLPSWSQTHLVRYPTTLPPPPPVKPTGPSFPSPAKAGLANPCPFGARSSSSASASIPRGGPGDTGHCDRRWVSSQTHKHASSVGSLPSSLVSPLIHARKWQV